MPVSAERSRSSGDRCGDGVKFGTSSGVADLDDVDGRDERAGSSGGSKCRCGQKAFDADITIVQHLSSDGTDAFAEVAGGEVIPPERARGVLL